MAWYEPDYLYTYGLGTESWIEISSNPSASSLSSAGDEVVTTGLRVQHDASRQRRYARSTAPTNLNLASRRQSVGGSSQDEYEESESESEKLMSSNEGLQLPLPSARPPESSSEDGVSEAVSDNDEISTAINYRPSDTCFTPQPNAFSHPRSTQTETNPQPVPGSYFPPASRPSHRNSVQRHSYSHPRQQQHSPFNAISPSYQADHDAALRASLSTLLSCAAAARGLPKSSSRATTTAIPYSNRIDTNTLRMVPEAVALAHSGPSISPGEPPFNPTLQRPSSPARTTSSDSKDSAVGPSANTKNSKRKSAAGTSNAAATSGGRSSSKDRRAAKKPRRSSGNPSAAHHHWGSGSPTDDGIGLDVSPTLLTWVVSAGVVVLVSALSFGAGFSMGREAGRAEVLGFGDGLDAGDGGLRNASSNLVGCGRENIGWGGWRGRLKWSGMVGGASSMVA